MAKLNNAGIRALAYVRVSTVEQTRFGISLEAQEDRLRAYCHMKGLELIEVIREGGVSGSTSGSPTEAGVRWVVSTRSSFRTLRDRRSLPANVVSEVFP